MGSWHSSYWFQQVQMLLNLVRSSYHMVWLKKHVFRTMVIVETNLKLILISLTWDCTTFYNFLPKFQKEKDFHKLARVYWRSNIGLVAFVFKVHNCFLHIHQGFLIVTWVMIWLPQGWWINPEVNVYSVRAWNYSLMAFQAPGLRNRGLIFTKWFHTKEQQHITEQSI